MSFDYYEDTDNIYERLKKEYLEHGKIIIAVDFDDTLKEYRAEEESIRHVKKLLKRWEPYSFVYIWTARDEERQKEVVQFCKENYINFENINEGCKKVDIFNSRKPYYNILLDDRAGLGQACDVLETLISDIEERRVVYGSEFNAKRTKDRIVKWIREWFEENGNDCKAVIGISGGIDSSTCAALCVEALGKDRVVGVLMPNGEQSDISYSHMLCDHLEIDKVIAPIGGTVAAAQAAAIEAIGCELSTQTKINLPARIRMATLYAISQTVGGRVINTCNLSESYCGFDTRWGDGVGDMSPLAMLTKTEVRALARELGLPDLLVNKVPTDGLCGKTDEEVFGFTYEVLDKYLREGVVDDMETYEKIDSLHQKNLFKQEPMPCFKYIPGEVV